MAVLTADALDEIERTDGHHFMTAAELERTTLDAEATT
jgi:hypothetical protein